MTTPSSPVLSTPARAPLRLTLAASPSRGNLAGAWWPQSRDLALELADLVDGFPTERGRVMRALFSRPDWDATLRRITTRRGIMKVGSFPADDTHMMILSMSTQPARLYLLVVPSETDEGTARALMAAAPSTDTHSVAALLSQHDAD